MDYHDSPLLSIPEAAARLGVHPNSVRRWYKSGRLKGWRLGPKLIRFRPEDLEAFAAGAQAPAGVAV